MKKKKDRKDKTYRLISFASEILYFFFEFKIKIL